MLQEKTVERGLFELLKKLMSDEQMNDFYLVGGTALSLTIGHRKSIDLDLFSQQQFDIELLREHLTDTYQYILLKSSNATLIGQIGGIKVDCIRYNYPLINPLVEIYNIRMASIADIAAMKLTAISQSGNRLKDFVDIAFLSSQITFNEMLSAFEKKFPKTDKMNAVRGLTYFEDIDFSVKIELVNGTFNWKKIEKRLIEMVKYPNKLFTTNPVVISTK